MYDQITSIIKTTVHQTVRSCSAKSVQRIFAGLPVTKPAVTEQCRATYMRYAMVTCEIKLFQNYFSIPQWPSEIILFQRVETCLKLFQNNFAGLLQLVKIFQHVHCR